MIRRLTLLCLTLAASLTGCGLPPLEGRPTSHALDEALATQTPLGKGIAALRARASAADGDSGHYALFNAREAFAARALLARAAQQTLDVQYYIWRADKTGQLLLRECLLAADRGVRVRMLLDDAGTAGLDHTLLALHSHPHIEVRLFNPFVVRWPKGLGYATEFSRLNRRMHNKSFTADNQATIVGGRNVGNEYFGATDGVLFADLDLLTVGPVVQDVSRDFDRYWASASAYPVDAIVTRPPATTLDALRTEGDALLASAEAQDFRHAIQQTPFIQNLVAAQLPVHWARARLVSDDPAKALNQADERQLIGMQIVRALGTPKRSLDIVSPYFVPTDEGVEALTTLTQAQVRVRVLTNSVQATDVVVVHAGYAKYREPLLRHGVELFELRKSTPDYADDTEKKKWGLAVLGSSGSSLHAKTMAVDGERIFVGSFNFDPRSAALNTEMGMVLESPALAHQLQDSFRDRIPATSYRVTRNAEGQLQWHSGVGQPPPVYDAEPDMGWVRRFLVWAVGVLPVEWLL
jgi:putative cardiolipin synthase